MKTSTLLILFAFLSIAATAQIPSYIPIVGLRAWYPFTGNPNDSSGYMNHGTVYGGTTFSTDRFGNPNSCFQADSVSAIDFPTNFFPTGDTERTVSIFFKLDSPYANSLRELFAWGNNSFVGSRFGLEIVYDTAVGWESTGGAVLTHFNKDTFWHNLTVTYPPAGGGTSSIKLFLDGEAAPITSIVNPVAVLNTPSGFIHTAGSLFISPYLYGFFGKLDDLAIWDRELTPCEIEKIFYGPVPIPNITVAGNVLSTDTTYTSYQWILSGTPIAGATTHTYTMPHGGMYKIAVVTKAGCLDTSVVYTATLNTAGFSTDDVVTISPNPSYGLFYIQSPYPVKAVLSNMYGQIISQPSITSHLDLHNFPKGFYFVSLFNENGLKIKTERISWLGD